MLSKPNKSNGFTLIEIILALALATISMGILHSALSGAFASQLQMQKLVKPRLLANKILNQLESDFQGIPRPTGLFLGTFLGQERNSDAIDKSSEILSYYTTDFHTVARNKKAPIKFVRLSLEAIEGREGYRLMKTIDTDFMSATPDEKPRTKILGTDIHELSFTYYDGNDWLEQWDSAKHENTLPLAVKIKLTITLATSDEGNLGESRLFSASRIVSLPCSLNVAERKIGGLK